ncbi:MAG TPA: thermonuclease family protein [Thermoleophilaceae bacterium]|nr:thermonuclease family protein [Thermoleophilaceae bacterium]
MRRSTLSLVVAAVLAALVVLGRSDGAHDADRPRPNRHSATVQRVVDGDTVRLAGLGSVRLIGIDTPEVYGGRVECFGPEASAFARSVLRGGTRVRYRVGAEPRDRYGRLLAYVWLPDGRLFNAMLAERGYATTLTIPPNDDLAPRFRAAERRARAHRRGMWRRPGCAS